MCGVAPERQSAGRTRLARPELVTLYGVWIPGTLDPGVGRAPWTGQRVVLRRFVALGKEFSQTTWWIVGGGCFGREEDGRGSCSESKSRGAKERGSELEGEEGKLDYQKSNE